MGTGDAEWVEREGLLVGQQTEPDVQLCSA